jgi:hypothetical protein
MEKELPHDVYIFIDTLEGAPTCKNKIPTLKPQGDNVVTYTGLVVEATDKFEGDLVESIGNCRNFFIDGVLQAFDLDLKSVSEIQGFAGSFNAVFKKGGNFENLKFVLVVPDDNDTIKGNIRVEVVKKSELKGKYSFIFVHPKLHKNGKKDQEYYKNHIEHCLFYLK